MALITRYMAALGSNFDVPKQELGANNLQDILHVVFGFAAGIALIIIIIGAIQYVISQGNPQSTAKAKNTIMYALIGLVVCILAFSIVGFVVRGTK